jgi:hypothetical protein
MNFDSTRVFQIAGNAVATDSAFLTFVSKKDAAWGEYNGSGAQIGGMVGGAVGGLIGGLIDGAKKKEQSSVEPTGRILASEIPQKFYDALGWPPSKVEQQVCAWIYPYNELENVRMPWWGEIMFRFQGKKCSVPAYMLKRKKIREFLASVGLNLA